MSPILAPVSSIRESYNVALIAIADAKNTVAETKAAHRKKLGAEMRAKRKSVHLTARELAKRIGASTAELSFVETGARMPTERIIQAYENL